MSKLPHPELLQNNWIKLFLFTPYRKKVIKILSACWVLVAFLDRNQVKKTTHFQQYNCISSFNEHKKNIIVFSAKFMCLQNWQKSTLLILFADQNRYRIYWIYRNFIKCIRHQRRINFIQTIFEYFLWWFFSHLIAKLAKWMTLNCFVFVKNIASLIFHQQRIFFLCSNLICIIMSMRKKACTKKI